VAEHFFQNKPIFDYDESEAPANLYTYRPCVIRQAVKIVETVSLFLCNEDFLILMWAIPLCRYQ
jgi:hypothetical protein